MPGDPGEATAGLGGSLCTRGGAITTARLDGSTHICLRVDCWDLDVAEGLQGRFGGSVTNAGTTPGRPWRWTLQGCNVTYQLCRAMVDDLCRRLLNDMAGVFDALDPACREGRCGLPTAI